MRLINDYRVGRSRSPLYISRSLSVRAVWRAEHVLAGRNRPDEMPIYMTQAALQTLMPHDTGGYNVIELTSRYQHADDTEGPFAEAAQVAFTRLVNPSQEDQSRSCLTH